VARALLAQGHEVIATARATASVHAPGAHIIAVDVSQPHTLDQLRPFVSEETRVLHSIPNAGEQDATPAIMQALAPARRVVYLSTTGVYGDQATVDALTTPAPTTPRARLRLLAEQAVLTAPSPLVLRPAAIYGPYRGVHAALRDGTFRLAGEGNNYVSRVHVDDLAAHCLAALLSDVTGAWPVADEEPCTSREIAAFCANLIGLPMPPSAAPEELSETRQTDRRVDGSAIRQALGTRLRYPSYRTGIPACMAEEAGTPEPLARAKRAR
jgi:nucleoside-diphosphate-sugar epimerase